MAGLFGINFGGIFGSIMGWASSLFFWALIGIGLFVFIIGFLWIKKQRKFKFPCLEVIGLGEGKVMTSLTKCGWFRSQRKFFGLWEYGGEEELIVKDGRKIQCASSVDYHTINGKRGIIAKRKDDDPEILVPLSKVKIENLKLIGEIAPADYRDAAVNIIEKYEKETMTWWQQNAPIIVLAGVIIFALIALIIIFNFAKGESSAWREFAEASRNVVTVASTTAP